MRINKDDLFVYGVPFSAIIIYGILNTITGTWDMIHRSGYTQTSAGFLPTTLIMSFYGFFMLVREIAKNEDRRK